MFRAGMVWDDCDDIKVRHKHVPEGGKGKALKRHLGSQKSHYTNVKSVFDFVEEQEESYSIPLYDVAKLCENQYRLYRKSYRTV